MVYRGLLHTYSVRACGKFTNHCYETIFVKLVDSMDAVTCTTHAHYSLFVLFVFNFLSRSVQPISIGRTSKTTDYSMSLSILFVSAIHLLFFCCNAMGNHHNYSYATYIEMLLNHLLMRRSLVHTRERCMKLEFDNEFCPLFSSFVKRF